LFLAGLVPVHFSWAGCAPVAMGAPRIWHAAASDETVEISFLGHASFKIVSPGDRAARWILTLVPYRSS
jgi:hypothetical protein